MALLQQLEAQQTQLELQQTQLEAQQRDIETLRSELAQLRDVTTRGDKQQAATQRSCLSVQQQVTELQARLQQQEAVAHKQAVLSDEVSRLAAKHEQQSRQRQLEECQRSLVVKDAQPLPKGPAAAFMQQMLRSRLGVQATVHAANLLGGERDSSTRRTYAYKVVLGSTSERHTVLKAKAKALKGTTLSIDVLLTAEQANRKHSLIPVARQAKSDGRRVQWRYDTLLLDGKPYQGPGSLPLPSQQSSRQTASAAAAAAATAAERQQSTARPQAPAVAPAQPQPDADGFLPSKAQVKRQRRQQRKQARQAANTAGAAADNALIVSPRPPPGLGHSNKPTGSPPASPSGGHSKTATNTSQPPAPAQQGGKSCSGTSSPAAAPAGAVAAFSSPCGTAAAEAHGSCSRPPPSSPARA